jgi:hypothetical protein
MVVGPKASLLILVHDYVQILNYIMISFTIPPDGKIMYFFTRRFKIFYTYLAI